jgi:hypothetical protein
MLSRTGSWRSHENSGRFAGSRLRDTLWGHCTRSSHYVRYRFERSGFANCCRALFAPAPISRWQAKSFRNTPHTFQECALTGADCKGFAFSDASSPIGCYLGVITCPVAGSKKSFLARGFRKSNRPSSEPARSPND